jgi:cation:H+ antiporter
LLNLALIVAGVVALTIGGEAVVRGSLSAAARLGVSPLLAGLVIVGFGTSAPELVVSVDAVLSGHPDVAVGNVVGSNISNVLLILSICALVRPLATRRAILLRDGMTVCGASFLFVLLQWNASFDRIDALIALLSLAAYLCWAYWTEAYRNAPSAELRRSEAEAVGPLPRSLALTLIVLGAGLMLLVLGSQLLLTGATALAQAVGVSDALIGLTLVAVGTSLPELAVCVVAVLRLQSDIAVGNLLGSSIFNLLGVLGITALVRPLPVDPRITDFDQWVMLSSAVLVLIFLYTARRLSRLEGALLLGAYGAYLLVSFTVIP